MIILQYGSHDPPRCLAGAHQEPAVNQHGEGPEVDHGEGWPRPDQHLEGKGWKLELRLKLF